MKKIITRIAALLLVGTLLIQPEYPNPVPEPDSDSISVLNLEDEEPAPQKK